MNIEKTTASAAYVTGDRLRVGAVEGVWREYADQTDPRFIVGGALLYDQGNGTQRALLIPLGAPVERLPQKADSGASS